MEKPDIQRLTNFLIVYTKTLLGAGTYTARVAKCVGRIAEVYGYEININFFFHHITLNVVDMDDNSIQRTYVIPNHHAHVNFKLIFDLSALAGLYMITNTILKKQKSFLGKFLNKKSILICLIFYLFLWQIRLFAGFLVVILVLEI